MVKTKLKKKQFIYNLDPVQPTHLKIIKCTIKKINQQTTLVEFNKFNSIISLSKNNYNN